MHATTALALSPFISLAEFAQKHFRLGCQGTGSIRVAGGQRRASLLEELPDLRGCLLLLAAERTGDTVQSAFRGRNGVLCLPPQVSGVA